MIKKTIILILLSTLFISCNEGTRYDEPDAPITTNNTSIGNTSDNRPSLEIVKVDSVEKTMLYEKTYKLSKCVNVSVSIADILSMPDFVRVHEIIAYGVEGRKRWGRNYMDYHRVYSDDYELNSNIPDSQKSSYTIPQDSILRVTPLDDTGFVYIGPQDFVVIVKYEVKVKVPKSRVIGAD